MGFFPLFVCTFGENRTPKQLCKSIFLWGYFLQFNLLGNDVLGIFYCFC